jgi:hypothetical protein
MTAKTLRESLVRNLWEALLEHFEQGIDYLEQTLATIESKESVGLASPDVRFAEYLSIAMRLDMDELYSVEHSIPADDPTVEQFERLLDRRNVLNNKLDKLISELESENNAKAARSEK